eukprot:PhM_4_TR15909/c1_g1_i1/m.57845
MATSSPPHLAIDINQLLESPTDPSLSIPQSTATTSLAPLGYTPHITPAITPVPTPGLSSLTVPSHHKHLLSSVGSTSLSAPGTCQQASIVRSRVNAKNETIRRSTALGLTAQDRANPHNRVVSIPHEKIVPTAGSQRYKEDLRTVCLSYQTGSCSDGAQCMGLHVDHAYLQATRLLRGTPCCARHDDVFSRHVNHNMKGTSYRLRAVDGTLHDIELNELGITEALPSPDGVHIIDASSVCRKYLDGQCKFGKECRNVHVCREKYRSLITGQQQQQQQQQQQGKKVSPAPATPQQQGMTKSSSMQNLGASMNSLNNTETSMTASFAKIMNNNSMTNTSLGLSNVSMASRGSGVSNASMGLGNMSMPMMPMMMPQQQGGVGLGQSYAPMMMQPMPMMMMPGATPSAFVPVMDMSQQQPQQGHPGMMMMTPNGNYYQQQAAANLQHQQQQAMMMMMGAFQNNNNFTPTPVNPQQQQQQMMMMQQQWRANASM